MIGGGKAVLPFVVGLGLVAAGGYAFTRRRPNPDRVEEPSPTPAMLYPSMGGGSAGSPAANAGGDGALWAASIFAGMYDMIGSLPAVEQGSAPEPLAAPEPAYLAPTYTVKPPSRDDNPKGPAKVETDTRDRQPEPTPPIVSTITTRPWFPQGLDPLGIRKPPPPTAPVQMNPFNRPTAKV